MSLQTITISNTHLNQQTNRGSFYVQPTAPKGDGIILVIFITMGLIFAIIAMAIEIPRIPEWRDYQEYQCSVVNRTQTAIEFGYYEYPTAWIKAPNSYCDLDKLTPCVVLIANNKTGTCCSLNTRCSRGKGCGRRNTLTYVEYRNVWIGNLTCVMNDIYMPSKFIKCDPFDDDCVKFWFQTDTFPGCKYSNGEYAAYDECSKPKKLTQGGIVMIVFSCVLAGPIVIISLMACCLLKQQS